jgi:hypothetical protein
MGSGIIDEVSPEKAGVGGSIPSLATKNTGSWNQQVSK